MCTLNLNLEQATWLYKHLAADERLVAQRIRDLAGWEIERMADLDAHRREQHPEHVHVARAWE